MKIRKMWLSAMIVLGGLTAAAQAQQEDVEYVFNPHWYGQLQVGGQETLGEGSFSDLLAPNAQIAVGYQFNPLFGLRLGVNAWQSRGIIDYDGWHKWKYNYVAPALDVTFNLTNAIGGFNPKRLVDVNIFAGIGANVAFNNDEANTVNNQLSAKLGTNVLRNIWCGTKTRFLGQFGAAIDFRVSDRVKLGLELQANTLSDTYNSKKAANTDWYFNGLVGIKYTFGKSHSTRKKQVHECPKAEPQVVERVVEKVVEVPAKPAPAAEKKAVQPLRRDIFFKISTTNISATEAPKVKEVADYLDANPEATVSVTGYADKGTGSLETNLRLAKQRAQIVVDTLVKTYGISPDRIQSDSMDTSVFQPYPDPIQNRVAICIAK
jgi:outer membrane protein OmpA-like peptidoglycan-associated protein